MEKTLFIGGPLDGHRIAVEGGMSRYHCLEDQPEKFTANPEPFEITIKTIDYERARLANGGSVFWRSDGGVVDPITALIHKYPNPILKRLSVELLDELSLSPGGIMTRKVWEIAREIHNQICK